MQARESVGRVSSLNGSKSPGGTPIAHGIAMKTGRVVGACSAVVAVALGIYATCSGKFTSTGKALAAALPSANALGPDDESLAPVLRSSAQLAPLLDRAATLRLQVLISAPSGPQGATLWRNGYRLDAEYFYPASALKLFVATAALEKLGTLRTATNVIDLGEATPLRIYAPDGPTTQEHDSTNREGGHMTLGHEAKKALIVSNNDSFNILLDFVGYDEVAQRMKDDGFESVRVRHYLGSMPMGDARRNPRMQLVPAVGPPIEIAARESTMVLPPSSIAGQQVGGSYLDEKGQKQSGPMSFEGKNRASLRDLQDLLILIVKPELLPERSLPLKASERSFLLQVLGTAPSESRNPAYDAYSQSDSTHRPLLFAVRKAMPGHKIHSYEKNGQAYAFVTQNTYLIDETTGRSVFVAATVYVNGSGTMNQEQYRYEDVTQPLFDGLAEVIAKTYLN